MTRIYEPKGRERKYGVYSAEVPTLQDAERIAMKWKASGAPDVRIIKRGSDVYVVHASAWFNQR